MSFKALIISNEVDHNLVEKLAPQYTEVITARNYKEAIIELKKGNVGLILLRIELYDLLMEFKEIIQRNNIAVMIIPSNQDLQKFDFLDQPDDLTKLPSKALFYAKLAKLNENNVSLALVMIDLDLFKKINDSQGHLAGDELLKQVAKKIRSSLRASDLIARFGGEEFILALPYTDTNQACIVIERIRQIIKQDLGISASFGISSCQAGDILEDSINRADKALYKAKEQGRDQIAIM